MKSDSLIYAGAKIGIMGLGVTGRAAVRYCRHLGAELFISDNRPKEQFLKEEGQLLCDEEIEWEAGGHSRDFLKRVELLLVSPGVDMQLPLLQELRDDGIKLVGELAVAAGQIEVPLVAVTGTNGKTTVTTLIGEIFAAAGRRVFVGGNIGTPLYEYLLKPDDYDIVVAEVSSFQLENADTFAPDVALLLNISPDHLDRHLSMENYVRAKKQLFAHQRPENVAIINGDDQLCLTAALGLSSLVKTFGEAEDSSAVISDNGIALKIDGATEHYSFDSLGKLSVLTLKNYAAAILTARSLGCSFTETETALLKFRSLPHRVEFVAEIDGVSYYNDSKATNTGAVIGALGQFGGNVILLAGGRDKGDDYSLLRDSVKTKVKKMVLLGEAAGLFREALGDLVDLIQARSMEEAVQLAATVARVGDVVLLSPACASFDMFRSYGHRGNVFKEAVLAMQAERKGSVR